MKLRKPLDESGSLFDDQLPHRGKATYHPRTRFLPLFISIVAISLALAQTARAASTFNEQIPFNVVAVDACPPGNPLNETGNIHIVGHLTVDSNGGRHGDLSSNLDSAVAVDQVTGTTYRLQDNGQTTDGFPPNYVKFNDNNDPTADRFEFTQQLHGGLEAQGGAAPNLRFSLHLHMTFLSDGTVTADVNDFTVTCQ